MKNLLKNIIYFFLARMSFRGAVILMYHSIGGNNEFFTVRVDEFERHMRYLSDNKFNVISLRQLSEILKNGLPFKRKTIVVTFDDGYEDNYVNAYPVLKKHNLTATIFVSTANIGKTVRARRGTELNVLGIGKIKEMQESGLISFGSHADNHIKLAHLKEKDIIEEMSESKNKLKDILREYPLGIAYPSGSVNELVTRVASRYFSIGCGVKKGRVFHGNDPLDLKRNSVDSEVNFTQFKGIAKFGRI